jgi:nucleoside-diphosphate-sugar epimerase
METLLVTGATGFVGRNLLLHEIARGTRILAPVRSAEKLRAQLVFEGLEPSAVTPLPPDPAKWDSPRPDRALLSAGVLFARDREEYFATNVDWTLQILEALPESTRIVVLSSQSAGGPTPHGRAARTESDADTPLTWYGQSKLALERAIGKTHTGRPLSILRPPMILGPRDTATLPLFKMAAGLVRTKPGLRRKHFSFLAVEDVLEAIHAAWKHPHPAPRYIAADHTITDRELIDTAARAARAKGVTLPIPIPIVKAMSLLVDAIPALRRSAPSLTRDRAKEIWPDRWVVDSTAFRQATGWTSRHDLAHALQSAHAHYLREGALGKPAQRPACADTTAPLSQPK